MSTTTASGLCRLTSSPTSSTLPFPIKVAGCGRSRRCRTRSPMTSASAATANPSISVRGTFGFDDLVREDHAAEKDALARRVCDEGFATHEVDTVSVTGVVFESHFRQIRSVEHRAEHGVGTPLGSRLLEVGAVVDAARLLARQRAERRQSGDRQHVHQLPRARPRRRELLHDTRPELELALGFVQRLRLALDPHLAPHHRLQGVQDVLDVHAQVGPGSGTFFPEGPLERNRSQRLDGTRGNLAGAPSEDQSLQERVRTHAVRAVEAGARYLADREQAGHGGLAVEVDLDPADHVVRSGANRDVVLVDVDPEEAADRRDPREQGVGILVDVRDVEIDVGITRLDHARETPRD